MPMRRRTSLTLVSGPQMSTPSTSTWPESGVSRRLTHRSSVDLPEPDGPMTTTTSRRSTWKSMPLSTSLSPKRLVRPRMSTAGPS